MRRVMRWVMRLLMASGVTTLLSVPLLFATAAPAQAVNPHGAQSPHGQQRPPHVIQQKAPVRNQPWPASVLRLAESLPVQDGGRVKPLHTYASFTLLRLNGKRSVKTQQGDRLSPMEWLLDTMFFAEMSMDYPVFLVQNADVIEALGIRLGAKRKRDRYSYREIRPGVKKLFQLAHDYGAIDEKQRTSIQQQVYILAGNVNTYVMLTRHFDYARHRIPIRKGTRLHKLFREQDSVPLFEVIQQSATLQRLHAQLNRGNHSDQKQAELDAMSGFMGAAQSLAEGSKTLALIPPVASAGQTSAWLTPSDMFKAAMFKGLEIWDGHLELMRGFETVTHRSSDMAALERALGTLHGKIRKLASKRNEYGKIGLELTYYKSGVLSWSLYGFVLAFLAMAVMWLRPRGKLLYRVTLTSGVAATLLLVVAITMRCIIRGRPPVSTLYETVLFVTAVGVIVALFLEFVNKKRIAVSTAAILGMVGLFIANGYEVLDKKDTMPSLVAVLDTNFWLATHVTAITIGYSAGMLAALMASIYLIAKATKWKRDDRAFYFNLGRMVYGVLCFGMIFTIVGTILGGIWANESWGRFWGWDPKENGALLIALSQIAILHGRMGGYLREHGICMAAAFSGTIIAFSWWGVNLLGVGLHSYGFTSGIHTAVWTYYGIQWGIVGLGGWAWWRDQQLKGGGGSAGAVEEPVGDAESETVEAAEEVEAEEPALVE